MKYDAGMKAKKLLIFIFTSQVSFTLYDFFKGMLHKLIILNANLPPQDDVVVSVI